MNKIIRTATTLAPLAALVFASTLAAQDPPKGREAAPAPKAAALDGWFESFFGWGAGELKVEEVPQIRVPGYRGYRAVKNYAAEPKSSDQIYAALEEGGKGILVGEVLPDEARAKAPAPVRGDADLAGFRELLKRFLPGNPRLTLDPSLDRKGWKGIQVWRNTGYGEYPVIAYVSAHDGSLLFIGHFWDRTRSVAEQRREAIRLADTPAVGPADARVTVVEYSDMQCPSCKKRTLDWDALQAKLAGELKIRRYLKSFPLTDNHPWAFRAASAGRCFFERTPELYFRFKSNVYARQDELNVAAVDAFAFAFAGDQGISDASFKGCYLQPRTNEKILADLIEGWNVRVRSTPTYFIDGVAITWHSENVMEEFLRKTYLGGRGLPLPAAKAPATK